MDNRENDNINMYQDVPRERHRRSGRSNDAAPRAAQPAAVRSAWESPEPEQSGWTENRPKQADNAASFYSAAPQQDPMRTPEPTVTENPNNDGGNGGGSGLRKIVFALLIVIVAVALVLLLGGKGKKEEPVRAQVLEIKTNETSVMVNNSLLFHLTTNKAADDVRLEDAYGTQIACTKELSEDTESASKFWLVKAVFTEPYSGEIYVSVREGDVWTRTDAFVPLTVVLPTATPAPTEAPTPEPTAVPTMPPTAVPTLAPTETPSDEPAVMDESTTVPTMVAVIPTWAPANATEAPTETPTLEPTQEPTPVPTAEPTAVPTEAPTPVPRLTASAADSAAPGLLKISETLYEGAKAQEGFYRERGYIAPDPDLYTYYEAGVVTFRGDNFRRNAAFGTAEVEEGKLEVIWSSPIGSMRTDDEGTLYGVGWTGQPAIVKWTREVRQMMNLNDEKKDVSPLREVIFAALDGKVHFLDLTDGRETREPITIGYPVKGSVSIDTYGRPLLAVGQGLSKLPNKTGTIGLHVFNLINGKELFMINGRSSKTQKQYGTNGACDGTPLFLYDSDAMIFASENGLLYTVDLNTVFDYPNAENPDKEPSLQVSEKVQYLYTKSGSEDKSLVSVESSVAMYDRYIFMADMYGILRCVDSDDMTTVWAADMGDNTDAAIALDRTENGVALYTGNTVYNRLKSKKLCTVRRLDALTGEELWRYETGCDYDRSQQAGCKASPVVGENALSELVFFTLNKVTKAGSRVVALEKETGREVWSFDMASTDTISSPVAVYNAEGRGWIIQADGDGTLHMLDGLTGKEITSLSLSGTIQGSPAVYKDILVIGTCDKGNSNMYGICIK